MSSLLSGRYSAVKVRKKMYVTAALPLSLKLCDGYALGQNDGWSIKDKSTTRPYFKTSRVSIT